MKKFNRFKDKRKTSGSIKIESEKIDGEDKKLKGPI